MEKAYVGMMGGYTVLKDGDEKHKATHIVLTIEEYNKLIKSKNLYKAKLENERDEHKIDIKEEKAKYERYKEELEQETQKKINEAVARAEQAEEEARYQTELNKTLLEISKNRANADRKLRPKKEHSGYVVVSSTEKKYKYKDGRNLKEIDVWETVLQSPYNMDFSEKQVRKQIQENLFNDKWLIAEIGINAIWDKSIKELFDDEEYKDLNCKIEEKIRANYKSGYWEIIYTHLKPLDVVPKEMRAS